MPIYYIAFNIRQISVMDVTSQRTLRRKQDARMLLPLSRPHFRFLPNMSSHKSQVPTPSPTINKNELTLHTSEFTVSEDNNDDKALNHNQNIPNIARIVRNVALRKVISNDPRQLSPFREESKSTRDIPRVRSGHTGLSTSTRRSLEPKRPATVCSTRSTRPLQKGKVGPSYSTNDIKIVAGANVAEAWVACERDGTVSKRRSQKPKRDVFRDVVEKECPSEYTGEDKRQFHAVLQSIESIPKDTYSKCSNDKINGVASELDVELDIPVVEDVNCNKEPMVNKLVIIDKCKFEENNIQLQQVCDDMAEETHTLERERNTKVSRACKIKVSFSQDVSILNNSIGEARLNSKLQIRHARELSTVSENKVKKCTNRKSVIWSDSINKQVKRCLKESMNRAKEGRRAQEIDRNVVFDHPPVEEMSKHTEKKSEGAIFRKTAMFVQYAARIMLCMIHLSSMMAPRSATEEQWHALNTSDGARDMAFNKGSFAKKRDRLTVPKWATQILDKLPDARSEKELRRLHALLRGLKSFDKFTEQIQISMCRSFTYHSVKSGRIILRQGHVGINFYFLYTGSVFVNIDDTDVHGNQFTKTEVVLWRGDSFGELALLQDIRRTATISAREDCELLVVDKDTFSQVCPRIFERELEEKINFLRRLPLFGPLVWDKVSLRNLCFESQILEYKANKVIVEDNTKEDWVYVCMEGKCDVIQKFNLQAEIERRNYAQAELIRRQSVAYNGNDVINLIGLLGTRKKSVDLSGDVIKENGPVSVSEGKIRLLNSMGLEYKKLRKNSVPDSYSKRQRRDSRSDVNTVNTQSETVPVTFVEESRTGPLTLTSMLSRDRKCDVKYLYLSIKRLQPLEIFDMSNLLGHRKHQDTGTYVLVSAGARLLRVKRTSFLRNASQAGIQLAKPLLSRGRYPSDDVLLRCYRDYLRWDVYKKSMVVETVKHKQEQRHKSVMVERSIDAHRETIRDLTTAFDVADVHKKELRNWEQLQHLSVDDGPCSNTALLDRGDLNNHHVETQLLTTVTNFSESRHGSERKCSKRNEETNRKHGLMHLSQVCSPAQHLGSKRCNRLCGTISETDEGSSPGADP